ncbi:MAG: hypothetical protein ACW98G_08955 [Candidatus Hodarchaeales archaeon]|jgi:hypothetical protein
MSVINLPEKSLKWLLEDQNPPVRNLTKKFILNKELTELDLEQTNDYSPIQTILSLMNSNGSWDDSNNPYKKYTGTYWQIIFLSDLNASNQDKRIQEAIEHVFTYQLENGTFPHSLKVKFGILCLTANVLRSCIHFGFENDERVKKGVEFISQSIIQKKGAICSPIYLLPDCQMALTKILAMYASMELLHNSKSSQKAIEIIIDKITENKILFYIPSGAKEYYKAIKGKKTSEIKEIQLKMSKDPKNIEKTEIKKSWTKFGFPNSYTSDALETVYWLAMINPVRRPEYQEALKLIIQRMDPSGFWKNENTFRNPMLTEIEAKKAPSKWLTFRAYFVLKTFCDINLNE